MEKKSTISTAKLLKGNEACRQVAKAEKLGAKRTNVHKTEGKNADAFAAKATEGRRRWNSGSLMLHSIHAMLLIAAIFMHPVYETSLAGALP